MPLTFEYFYGNEAEQFTFFRIPKVLFTDKRFKDLSTDAKLLYGLMLDRMGLSIKNRWLDKANHVYIIYTMEDIIADLGCARQKSAKLLDELENNVGLIERKRQGLGKPNIIYVKNFTYTQSTGEETQNTGSMNVEHQEVRKSNLQKYENHTSRNMILENQEVPKSYSNNTEYNNTEYSDTEILSHPIEQQTEMDTIRWAEERRQYEQLIKQNIDYDITVHEYEKAWLDEILMIMVDVVCSREPTIRINKQEYPKEVVKSRFLKINASHIEYIHFALRENTSNVRNIRAFLITTIYRSFETADNWYLAKVNHDMAQGGI